MLLSDLPTPALLVDRARLHANLDAMQARAEAMDVALRPHAKTHKSPDLARLQLARGARGLTVATVDEAEAFAEAGVDDIRLATPIVGPQKLERLQALASGGTRISFSVDSGEGVRRASEVFASGPEAEVLIEMDTGYGRCGVPWDEPEAALALARQIADAPGVRLVGVLSHGGDAYAGPLAGETRDEALRRVMDEECDRALAFAGALARGGFLDPATRGDLRRLHAGRHALHQPRGRRLPHHRDPPRHLRLLRRLAGLPRRRAPARLRADVHRDR